MGFDMYWRNYPIHVAEARERFHADMTDENFAAYQQAEADAHCYWRQSVWTMANFNAMLDALGCYATVTDRPYMDSAGDEADRQADVIQSYRLEDNSGWVVSAHQCAVVADKLGEVLASATHPRYPDVVMAYATGQTQSPQLERVRASLGALVSELSNDGVTVITGAPDDVVDAMEYATSRLPYLLAFFDGAALHGDGFEVW